MANYATEKFLNRLMGRTEVEDALQRLDMLTKEETGMTVARNLAVGHAVEGIVTAIKDGAQSSLRFTDLLANCMVFPKTGFDDQKRLLLLMLSSSTIEIEMSSQGTSRERSFANG
jgi:hypothetical protein